MSVKSNCLLLTYSSELEDGKLLYVSSNCLPVKAAKLEPAGVSFHAAALRLSGHDESSEPDDEDKSSDTEVKDKGFTTSYDAFKSKGRKQTGGDKDSQDHYALLGLSHLRFLATEDQIRKSYREAALKHHPDKQAAILLQEDTEEAKELKKDEIETHFKAIQEAYEVLIDPARRRVYDSTDEFDDEVPSECSPEDFFKVFGPVFMRNSRWSVAQPVPPLGDNDTSIQDVDKFYAFWDSFKSWREFPQSDEFDLEQAESREHKRWMERQNAKLQEKAKKEEYARIRTLVDNAYKKDPRVMRRKEEEKLAKIRKKEAKLEAKKKKEEEAARAIEEERLKKEEEEKKAAEAASSLKKLKEKEKKLLRKEKSRLRAISASVTSNKRLGVTADDVENICSSFDMQRLRNLCDRSEHKEDHEKAHLLKGALNGDEDKSQDTKTPQENGDKKEAKKSEGPAVSEIPFSSSEKKEKPWSREEVEMLRKGVQKYPKGTSQRWEVISNYIGTGRTVEEILKAVKTVLLQKPDTAQAFDSFLEKRKAVNPIASPLSTRDDSPANGAIKIADIDKKKVIPETVQQGAGNNSKTSSEQGEKAEAVPNGSGASDQDTWSAVQERALVQALKTFPKDTPQRWERVAAAVPGRTKVQCMKKFTEMKDNFRSKKST